jgi:hypothetical protein
VHYCRKGELDLTMKKKVVAIVAIAAAAVAAVCGVIFIRRNKED